MGLNAKMDGATLNLSKILSTWVTLFYTGLGEPSELPFPSEYPKIKPNRIHALLYIYTPANRFTRRRSVQFSCL